MTHNNPRDITWIMQNADADVLCQDLDRVHRALRAIFDLSCGPSSTTVKNVALRCANDIIEYLRVAHDIG